MNENAPAPDLFWTFVGPPDASIYLSIPGGREFLEWLCLFPSFHDAEIVQLLLRRDAESELHLHWWKLERDTSFKNSVFRPSEHFLATFILEGIVDLELESFSCQNVISELEIRRAVERPDRLPYVGRDASVNDYELVLHGCYGLEGRLRCRALKVEFRRGKPKKKKPDR